MNDDIRGALKTYIVTLDASNPLIGSEQVFQYIRSSKFITNWWNWLPFVYIVESTERADVISEELRSAALGTRFLVAQIDLENSEGNLAREAWDWIMRRQRKSLPKMSQPAE